MIIFTVKERQFIDEAVLRFGNDRQRSVWKGWKLDHPVVRHDATIPADDGKGRMPASVVEVVTENLTAMERFLHTRIESVEVSDEEAADLCNDVAEIYSTVEAIRAVA
jgi:hypothetical protein